MEGVHADQLPGSVGLDVAIPKFEAEAPGAGSARRSVGLVPSGCAAGEPVNLDFIGMLPGLRQVVGSLEP